MKTTAWIFFAILWIAGTAQNQKTILQPRVKVVKDHREPAPLLQFREDDVKKAPATAVSSVPLSPEEIRDLMEEMLAWYEYYEHQPGILSPEQKSLLEKQLKTLILQVYKNDMDMVRKRYHSAQRWCDSMTRFIGMPSEICMEILKKSRAGYLSVVNMFREMEQVQHPEAVRGIMENIIDKMNQVLMWQEMAILEIHQYRTIENRPVEMMAADDE